MNMLRKGDLILILIVVAAAIGGFAYFQMGGRTSGELTAVIKKDNKVIEQINLTQLSQQKRVEIAGDYHNFVLAEHGRIRFADADCPDRLCVDTGWLTKKGQTAVCLPNKTIIVIEGASDEVDGSTY